MKESTNQKTIRIVKIAIRHPIRFITSTSWELKYKNPVYIGRCEICGLKIIDEYPNVSKCDFLSKHDYDELYEKGLKKHTIKGKLICDKCKKS